MTGVNPASYGTAAVIFEAPGRRWLTQLGDGLHRGCSGRRGRTGRDRLTPMASLRPRHRSSVRRNLEAHLGKCASTDTGRDDPMGLHRAQCLVFILIDVMPLRD
jgi:hypothetical protein